MSDTPKADANEKPAVPPIRSRRISGKGTAALLVLCLLIAAILVPFVLRLPVWIEFELVLAFWWVIWFVILTTLLYQGLRVSHDHAGHEPRSWLTGKRLFGSKKYDSVSQENSRPSPVLDLFPDIGGVDGEGCLFFIVILVLVAGVWLLFELALPAIFFLLYAISRGMIAQVTNDRHRCRNQLGRSLIWGFTWATLYTAPLALAVWMVHLAHQRMAGGN